MLKRVLLLLGETPSSVSARNFAFRLARDSNADIAGLAGVDLSYIQAPMLGGIGTTAFKLHMEKALEEQAQEARVRLHDAYENECAARGLQFEWLSFDGDPAATLTLAAETRDLVVTGHDTAFRGNVREQMSNMLANLLLTAPRPLVVCGDEFSESRDVLVAYDGSLAAMRAVQIFALLGLEAGRRTHVTSIDVDHDLAARRIVGVTSYLRSHGYEVEATPIATRLHPADVLRIEVADRKIGMLVAGAYGHRGLRERLFGSTTTQLVRDPPCALLLWH